MGLPPVFLHLCGQHVHSSEVTHFQPPRWIQDCTGDPDSSQPHHTNHVSDLRQELSLSFLICKVELIPSL